MAGLALAELLGHFYFAHRAPTPEQWAATKGAVESLRQPGDVVVIAPLWAEPVARLELGDALMPLQDVARPDATRYTGAVELSAMGARDPELRDWIVDQERKVGPITLRRKHPKAPAQIRYVFTDHVAPPTTATIVGTTTQTPCTFSTDARIHTGGLSGNPTFPAGRFQCPGGGADQFVGVTVIDDQAYRPRRCVWAWPTGGQRGTVLRFPNVPLGKSIVGHTGAHWMFERESKGTFLVHVAVNGKEIGNVRHEDGSGWTRFELPLGEMAEQKDATVEFRVEGQPRPACFEADTR